MKSVALAMLLATAPAAAQSLPSQLTPGPPGPYVIDLRGITLAVPQASTVYPPLPSGTFVPKRGFGVDGGIHVLPLSMGPARIGIGARVVLTRSTTQTPVADDGSTSSEEDDTDDGGTSTVTTYPRVEVTERLVAPDVSLNFGTANGWSYISAGPAWARLRGVADLEGERVSVTTKTSGYHFGGGARWFLSAHVGVGFDLRWYHVMDAWHLGASAGVSVK